MAFKARLTVQTVTRQLGGDELVLMPVYSSDPDDPNHSFSQATPSGKVELYVSNPALVGTFEPGKVYDVDFTEYVKPTDA